MTRWATFRVWIPQMCWVLFNSLASNGSSCISDAIFTTYWRIPRNSRDMCSKLWRIRMLYNSIHSDVSVSQWYCFAKRASLFPLLEQIPNAFDFFELDSTAWNPSSLQWYFRVKDRWPKVLMKTKYTNDGTASSLQKAASRVALHSTNCNTIDVLIDSNKQERSILDHDPLVLRRYGLTRWRLNPILLWVNRTTQNSS